MISTSVEACQHANLHITHITRVRDRVRDRVKEFSAFCKVSRVLDDSVFTSFVFLQHIN